jgi:amyloid beta precursor protein binding protein 1
MHTFIPMKIYVSRTADPSFLDKFSLVIASNLPSVSFLPLSNRINVPLILAQSYGLLGYVRIQAPEHEVVESRPDPMPLDLRIANPFPALLDYCNAVDLQALSSLQLGNLPFIVILIKAMQEFKAKVCINVYVC